MFQFSDPWECMLHVRIKLNQNKKVLECIPKLAKSVIDIYYLPSITLLLATLGIQKDSNNKMALICVGETISGINGHHVYNYKVGENLICVRGHTYETVKIRLL